MAGGNDKVVAVNDASFESEVMKSDLPVLVDFWAPWCGPCRAIGPIVSELSNEYAGKLKVVKVNTDESQRVAQNFRIMSIPTLMVFKGGKVVNTVVGAVPKAKIVAALQGSI